MKAIASMIKEDKVISWQVFRNNWHMVVALFSAIFMISKAYDMNNNQVTQINDLQSRVIALENHTHEDDTNWAVLKVQLSIIQTDINDIKNDLKAKRNGQ